MNPTKLLASVVCIAGALALTPITTLAQNLLVDPSFESGAFAQPNPILLPAGAGGGWAAFGSSITTAAAQSGTHSVLINDNGWSPNGLYQVLSATPGETFTLSAAFMTPDPTKAGYATPALVQLSFFDSTGAGIAPAFGPWNHLGAANTWVESPNVVATAPAGTAYVGAYLMMMDNNGANGFQMYFDDVSLTAMPAPEPSCLALLGLGFLGSLVWRRR